MTGRKRQFLRLTQQGRYKMIKVSNKARAAVVATAFGLFLATTSFAVTANAATVKNGVSCKKSGLKTKVGSKNYVCGKNPYITPTKLTWMLSTCKQAQDLLVQLKDAEEMMMTQASIYGYKTLTELGDALGGQEKKDIDDLVKGITDAESSMKNNLCKRGR
jgi:hypothetical protein